MSSAVQDRTDATPPSLDERLDELIPRPAPAWRRVLGGALIIAIAATGSWLWGQGYLVPMKSMQNHSSSSSGNFWVSTSNVETSEAAHPALLLERRVFNDTARDVRLVSVELDADGVELVDTRIRQGPEPVTVEYGNCITEGSTTTCSSITPGHDCTRTTSANSTSEICAIEQSEGWDPAKVPDDATSLPLVIPAHGDAELYLLIAPTACTGPSESPWGQLQGTFDFGDSAFPPFSNTTPIGEHLFDEWSTPSIISHDGPRATPAGEDTSLLAEACRILGR